MLQAIEITNMQMTIKVIADDTDVFMLLMYHIYKDMVEMEYQKYFSRKIYFSMEKYDPVVKKNVISLHIWTTSERFGHGKTSLSKILLPNQEIQICTATISDVWSTKNDVVKSGEYIFNSSFKPLRQKGFSSQLTKKKNFFLLFLPLSCNVFSHVTKP